MLELLTALTRAVEGAPLAAVAASFVWGILSIVLSPCHLASIPLIIGYLQKQPGLSAGKAFRLTTIFAIGILASIAVIGGVTAAAGRILGDVGQIGRYAVVLVFFLFGLNLMGVIPLNWAGPRLPKPKGREYLSVLFLGFIFGLALGPCTFAFMAPMLGVVFSLTAKNFLYGILLLAAFAVGHCAVIIAAGTSMGWVQRFIKWEENSKGISMIRKICGALVVLGGVYLLYSSF